MYQSIRQNPVVKSALHLVRAMSPFHNAKGTVAPDDELLDERTRTFRSPFTAAPIVLGLLKHDEDFLRIIPASTHQQYLVQIAVCGEEVRANFYLLEDDASLCRIYDDAWMNNGKFNYLLDYDKTVMLAIRDMPGKYYHPNDARISYRRLLSVEELALIDSIRNHHLT